MGRRATSQKSEDLNYTAAEASDLLKVNIFVKNEYLLRAM
jgi:hypothetical protein